MNIALRPLAAVVLVALTIAGCSDDAPENADTVTVTSSPSGEKKLSEREQGVKFAECMRDNGVGEFPDPDASGALTIDGILNGSSLDPDSAAWKGAISACKDLQPPGFTGRKRSTGEQAAGLRFAQCIRDNGVKDFPDPAKGEPLVDTNRIPSSATDEGMSILNAAMKQCGEFAAAAGAR